MPVDASDSERDRSILLPSRTPSRVSGTVVLSGFEWALQAAGVHRATGLGDDQECDNVSAFVGQHVDRNRPRGFRTAHHLRADELSAHEEVEGEDRRGYRVVSVRSLAVHDFSVAVQDMLMRGTIAALSILARRAFQRHVRRGAL